MASSSSSSEQQKHQVFLSFRGEDTRNNFTSHLQWALERKGIGYFIDDQLIRGEQISQALLTAIVESKISIIVFSKNYAYSSWCLDELSKILECKKRNGQMVVPIFYHVDPSHLRNEKGIFEEAFAIHQERFKDRTDKVEEWRAALQEVGSLSGYHIHPQVVESRSIKDIVEDISKKLIYKSTYDTEHLIGIDSHVKQVELLCFGWVDVRIVGIWGMGGIGKTTIAEVVYNQFFAKFDVCCFLRNVKEKYTQGCLREDLFCKILEDRNLNIGTSSLPACVKDRLRRKRVLIVIDDLDNPMQLDFLHEKNCFGPGSIIIVTSRDKQVFQQVVDGMYKVEGLICDDALQLFSLYAFKQTHPKKEFKELSNNVVRYAQGVPLALRVLGSAFYSKSKLFWEGELNKLKEIPNPKIDDILRISLNGLDDEVRNIFLDIACFFKGEDRDYVEDILKSCYISSMSGIHILFDKSLITISNNMLEMHELLQQMGQNIVFHESKELGERSRLWTHKDIYHVLSNNMGTGRVIGMFLDMSKTREIHLTPEAFAKMCNLKFLNFFYSDSKRERRVYISQEGLKYLSNNLSYLHWDDYPSKSLPLNFCGEGLVELSMPNSRVELFWHGVQDLVNLKRLDLSNSQHLVEIPDLSKATELEIMKLDGCTSLVEVPSSIQRLNKLWYLNLGDCQNLGNFPSSIHLDSLRVLILTNCSKVTEFPEISNNLEILYLSGTAIEEVPSSIEHLVELTFLDLNYCEKLHNLPSSIRKLKYLACLDLKNCSNITKFPKIPPNLLYLDLSGSAIKHVLSSIERLSQLPDLCLDNCPKLEGFQELIYISSLRELDPSRINFETIPAVIKQLLELQRLDLDGYNCCKQVPADYPLRLVYLDAHYCTSLKVVLFETINPDVNHERKEIINLKKYKGIDWDKITNTKNYIDLTKTRLKILEKATEDVKLYHQGSYPKSSISVCIPGCTLSSWFGDLSTSEFSLFNSPRMFLGFVVCIHVSFKDFHDDLRGFKCRFNFKLYADHHKYCEVSRFLSPWDEHPRIIASDYVLIYYDFDFYHTWYSARRINYIDQFSFEVSIFNSKGDLVDSEVKKQFAVRQLFTEDVSTELPYPVSKSDFTSPDRNPAPFRISVEKRPISQAQSRNDFLNILKTSFPSAVPDPVSAVSPSVSEKSDKLIRGVATASCSLQGGDAPSSEISVADLRTDNCWA